ncbi:MAG: radical SAM family heme chaperone HemW [Acutalibacteraceae bacterium]
MTGIYIHIPFCKSKCPYCDFYSFIPKQQEKDSYLKAVLSQLEKYKTEVKTEVDTLYFGGGTPSFFGGERLSEIITSVKENYTLKNAEITVECNPSSVDETVVKSLSRAGVNRISMGLQSADDNERKILGRLSQKDEVKNAIELFKNYGIDNISLDLMLGVPYQTEESLKKSLDFVISQKIKHISCYMLKIEEGTPFSKMALSLPDENSVCDMYLFTAEYLKSHGFSHYEISNFALPGYESRHNLKYWHCEEYLGIGPSAHSFLNGRRFYFSRDFEKFITDPTPIFDGEGGDEEEYIMLRLRLSEGLTQEDYKKRFGKSIPEKIIKKAVMLQKHGLINLSDEGISLTETGFLLSNSIISQLLY